VDRGRTREGALRRFAGEDWFYLFVSAKRSFDE
jgi:hypothetical protein